MKRTALILAIAFAITATVVAIIGWFAPVAGDAVMSYVRQDPGGPFWVRILTPVLPAFSIIAFGLIAAAWRRKVARVGREPEAR